MNIQDFFTIVASCGMIAITVAFCVNIIIKVLDTKAALAKCKTYKDYKTHKIVESRAISTWGKMHDEYCKKRTCIDCPYYGVWISYNNNREEYKKDFLDKASLLSSFNNRTFYETRIFSKLKTIAQCEIYK